MRTFHKEEYKIPSPDVAAGLRARLEYAPDSQSAVVTITGLPEPFQEGIDLSSRMLLSTGRGRVSHGEEVARAPTGQRPLNVVNPEVYAPGAVRRAR